MAIFDIMNVGQGDSIRLRPSEGCCYNRETIFIDLGSGKCDITKDVTDYEKIHIVLTHHDNDHLGGMHFFVGKMRQVKSITVPFYQNEITLIARAILNLKGIGISSDCNEFIKALEELLNNQVYVKTLVEGKKGCPKLTFAYEGNSLCDHIQCLNPPLIMESYDWIREMVKEDLIGLFYELFVNEFAQEMELYIRQSRGRYSMIDSQEFNRFWLQSEDGQSKEVYYAKCNFVLNFIMDNIVLFRNFNRKATRANLRKIYTNYVKQTHDVCVVLRTLYEGETFLLTGDASKKVFNRLIRSGKNISATYLKMPHHGSKYNMNEKILDKIAPTTVIISHDNGHFGKSKDTHPNQEILDLLCKKNMRVLLTNDVIKNNLIIMEKRNHRDDLYVEIK